MTKLVVTLLCCALLAGAALYVGGTKVAPATVTKSTSVNTSITSTKVNLTDGSVSVTAP